MKRKILCLSTLICLGTPSLALAEPSEAAERAAFAESSYGYCDAKVLAGFWKQSIEDSKLRIGRKLGWGDKATLEDMLAKARKHATKNRQFACTFFDAGFSYSDAEVLAKAWKTEPDKAKALAETKILNGDESLLRDLLEKKQKGSKPEQESKAFAGGPYTYCDAKLVSNAWGTSVSQSKLRIGRLLIHKKKRTVDAALTSVRNNLKKQPPKAFCSFAEAGLTSADAESLAKLWKVPVAQAKVRAERMLITKGDVYVTQLARKVKR